ncbi:hypothetical protein [Burkholderia gladioli]
MFSGKDPDLVREKFQHYFGRRLPLAKTVDDYDALLPWKMPAEFR